MDVIEEISSDSNAPTEEPDDNVIEAILKKYSSTCSSLSSGQSTSQKNIYDLSDEETEIYLWDKFQKEKPSNFKHVQNLNKNPLKEHEIDNFRNDDTNIVNKYKLDWTFKTEIKTTQAILILSNDPCDGCQVTQNTKTNETKQKKKFLSDKQLNAKKTIRSKNCEITEKARVIKEKVLKPEALIKDIIVKIDENISKPIVEAIKSHLENNTISFKLVTQLDSNIITWSRKTHTLDKQPDIFDDYLFVILPLKEFLQHLKNGTLLLYLINIKNKTNAKKITIALLGINKLLADQEFTITEIQIMLKTYVRCVKTNADLVALVLEHTKSISQIPYKLKKEAKYKQHSEYFSNTNKDCVRVDKNGNGVSRLWHQMLTMFPLVRLETAEAIAYSYPMLALLYQAYEECREGKDEILENLQIRRAINAGTRSVGPELSKKCFNFFCSKENILI